MFTRYFPEGMQIDTRANDLIVFKKTGSIVSRKSIRITTSHSNYEIVFPLGKGRINIVEM